MDRLWAVLILVLILAAGVTRLLVSIRWIYAKYEFTSEFITKFQQYIQSQGRDGEAYAWLIHRSNRMQTEMGRAGIVHHFRPPFANYAYSEYPIILNMLPEIRRSSGEIDFGLGRQFHEYANLMQEALIRHTGILDDHRAQLIRELKNPLTWFREGVQLALLSPFLLLRWLGVDQIPSLGVLATSTFVKFVGAVVGFIGLLASIVTILVGWEQAIAVVQKLVP